MRQKRLTAPPKGRIPWSALAIAGVLAFVAFLPALRADFVNWDDDVNFLMNPNYRGLGWGHLKWMFTTLQMGHYQPLSWMSLGFDYVLWGMRPFGYHLTNVLLHAANAALFCVLCRHLLALAQPDRTSDLDAASLFAALLFSVHPLRVESVAWVTERRDVLSGMFYLLTTIFYARRRLALALTFFALGLLCKGIGVTLPLIFVVLDFYPLRRLPAQAGRWLEPGVRGVWIEKIPFFALSLAAGLLGAAGEKHIGLVFSMSDFGVSARLAQSFYALAFYVWKTLWPTGLGPIYEARNPSLGQWPFWPCAVFVALATAAVLRARRVWPAGAASWACYVLALIPVLGLLKFGEQIAADRYTYLACLSWAVLAGGGLLRLLDGRKDGGRQAVLVVAGALCALLGALTWRQARVWKNSEALWTHAVALNADLVFAHNNLGVILADKGEYDKAIPHYRAALAINPSVKNAHLNLGNAFYKLGRRAEAIGAYRAALAVDPDYVQAQQNLAAALVEEGIAQNRAGRLAEATALFREAARVNPKDAAVLNNLGMALSDLGRLGEAMEYFKAALRVEPGNAQTHNGWGVALFRHGDASGAAAHYQEALRLDPGLLTARFNLAVVLIGRGRLDEAAAQYRDILQSQPDNAEAHFAAANLFADRRQWEDAAAQYRETLRLQPSHAAARNNLEIVLRRSAAAKAR
ncbi:MAG: tetratricopeptide repeat protein [Elusimicrobia bacterium]|nr:tetratricopeptide repeat protein [Elusimicrobiota bacterium]